MNLNNFSKKYFNLDSDDIIEVFRCMNYIKDDYSDWDEKLYSENLVENINKILKPKKLKEDLIEYRNLLIAILNSRNAKYTNDCVKSGLKKQIMKNKSLMNFCEGLYEDIEDDN